MCSFVTGHETSDPVQSCRLLKVCSFVTGHETSDPVQSCRLLKVCSFVTGHETSDSVQSCRLRQSPGPTGQQECPARLLFQHPLCG